MKKTIFIFLGLISINANAMTDYEFCKMLDDSGDPSETVKFVSESYFEGKRVKEKAQVYLNIAIAFAGFQGASNEALGGGSPFIPNCLKALKENRDKIFESE